MLAACRTAGAGFAVPTCAVVPREVAGCMEARWEFQAILHDCWTRREPRAPCFASRGGPCRALARQSMEPMARHVEGGTLRGLQRGRSDVSGDEEHRRWHSPQRVAEAMGDPEGGLLGDATGLVNKGADAVGVARPSCGILGQGEHGPGGVLAGEASQQGYALGDPRVFLPAAGVPKAYAARQSTCRVPQERTCQSTPPLAAVMLQRSARGTAPVQGCGRRLPLGPASRGDCFPPHRQDTGRPMRCRTLATKTKP